MSGLAPSLKADAWLARRDRLLASAAFQRWATAFLPTRFIARRRARELFDLTAGFVYSQVLAACVRLRLFEVLAAGPATAAELAPRLELPAEGTERLLEAAAALRLAERRGGGRYGLGVLGAALLGNPGVAAMVEHHRLLYADLSDPVTLFGGRRDTGLSRYWAYARSAQPAAADAARVAEYTALMAASQPLVAGEILDAWPLRRHRCLLDVGGGDGSFAVAAAARAPRLRIVVFDLPAVAERARARFAAAGIADRATAVGGDFGRDPLPPADVVTLVRVVHDHDDEAALRLLRAARAALAPGGTLLLAEPMADAPGAEPMAAYFHVYLWAMGQGRPRSPQRLAELLRAAGFAGVRRLRTRAPLLVGVLAATASGASAGVNYT
jgi:demethylspheroidene O-methyltransferase